ncbi:hypothetical protein [Nesterenkonia ebinurensis]|uniref:hypothetical protein n=1 Tax=Nesterenkonia ebinurensis TaxID=2608252 RepID=UPI00123D8D81|nr:hypothetical protein [Nesterenkonia ebinurensis]
MRYGQHITTTTALSTAGLLALAACAPEEELDPDPEPQETITETEEPEDEENAGEPDPAETETVTQDPEETEEEASEPEAAPEIGIPEGGTDRMEEADFEESLHGQEHDHPFSHEGEEVGVAGLSFADEPFQVRAAPTSEAEVVGELGPLSAAYLGGREREHPALADGGIWREVELADGYGWVETQGDGGDLFYFGETQDITEEYIDEVPPAEDPQLIAEGVAERSLGEDGEMIDEHGEPMGPDYTLISTPEDHGEEFYRIDVLGLMDDAMAGYRLFVTVEEAEGGYELIQVERTLICSRGITDGLCT